MLGSPRSTHSSLLTCPQTRVPAPSVFGPCAGAVAQVLAHISQLLVPQVHGPLINILRSQIPRPRNVISDTCELRVLCCRSYFGPRMCGRSITIFIEGVRGSQSGFPLLTPTMQAGQDSDGGGVDT